MKKLFFTLIFITAHSPIFTSDSEEESSIQVALDEFKEFVKEHSIPQPTARLTTSDSGQSSKKDHTNLEKTSIFSNLLKMLKEAKGDRPDLPDAMLGGIQNAYKAGIINWYNPQEKLAHCTKPGLLHTAAAHANSGIIHALLIAGASGVNEYNSLLDTPAHTLAMRGTLQPDALVSLALFISQIDPRHKDRRGRTVGDILQQSLEVRKAAGKNYKDIRAIIASIPRKNEFSDSGTETASPEQAPKSWPIFTGLIGGAASFAGSAGSAMLSFVSGQKPRSDQ